MTYRRSRTKHAMDGAAIYNSYEISEETALAILEAAY